jgi:cholesterol transport system auxiliary component
MRGRLLTLALAGLALSGCFGGGNAPSELLTLTAAAPRPPAQPRAAAQGQVITVTTPAVPQAVRTKRVPVYVSPTVIQYLQDAQWIEGPNELFRQLLSETIAARTPLTVLDPSVYTQIQGMMMSGQLIRFGLDPNAMEVVVEYEATLVRPQNRVATNRFQARVAVTEATAAAVAPALNDAANQVAEQVAAWVNG